MKTFPANDSSRFKFKVTIIDLNSDNTKPTYVEVRADNEVNAVQRACFDTPEWQVGVTVDTLRGYYLKTKNIVVKDVDRVYEQPKPKPPKPNVDEFWVLERDNPNLKRFPGNPPTYFYEQSGGESDDLFHAQRFESEGIALESLGYTLKLMEYAPVKYRLTAERLEGNNGHT